MAQLTIVTLYERFAHAEAAIRDLIAEGLPQREIGILAHNPRHDEADKPAAGEICVGARFVDFPEAGPAIAGGAMLALIDRVPSGIRRALGTAGIPPAHAELYADGVRCGGTLVTIRAEDETTETVRAALGRHRPIDINNRQLSTPRPKRPPTLTRILTQQR
ncbi:MAG TPA: hypothetical protein VM689_02945 [Aliidongia sp.]|nr:hypothetical protein [Aliidongia sp.]